MNAVIVILAFLLVILLALLSLGVWVSGSWTRAVAAGGAAVNKNKKSGYVESDDFEKRVGTSPEILVTLETHLPAWVAVTDGGTAPHSMMWPAVVHAQSPSGSVTMRRANASVTMEDTGVVTEDEDDGETDSAVALHSSRHVPRRFVTVDSVSIPANTIVVSVTLVSADDFHPGDSGCDISYISQMSLNDTLSASSGTITLPAAVLSVDGGHGPLRTLQLTPSLFQPRSPATLVLTLSRRRRKTRHATKNETLEVQLHVLAETVQVQLPRGAQTLLAYLRVPSVKADSCGSCPQKNAVGEEGERDKVHTVLAMAAMSVTPRTQVDQAKQNMEQEVDRRDRTLAPPERTLLDVIDDGSSFHSAARATAASTLHLRPWVATVSHDTKNSVIVDMPSARLWRQIISHETSYAEADLENGSRVTFPCTGRVVLESPPTAIRVVCQASQRGPSVLMSASVDTQWHFLLFPFGRSPSRKLGLVVGTASDGEVFAAQTPHGHVHWPLEASGSQAVAGKVTFVN